MKSIFEPSKSLIIFYVSGFSDYDGWKVFEELKIGTKVELRCEPDNPHNPEAVAIYYKDFKIGYALGEKSWGFFKLLYFGHEDILEAHITMVDESELPSSSIIVSISITDKRKLQGKEI